MYGEGPEDPSPLEQAVAVVLAVGAVASGQLAAVLHGVNGVAIEGPDITVAPEWSGRRAGVRRRRLDAERVVVVDGVRCTGAKQTMLDLSAALDDTRWEQALESALRKRLLSSPSWPRCRHECLAALGSAVSSPPARQGRFRPRACWRRS